MRMITMLIMIDDDDNWIQMVIDNNVLQKAKNKKYMHIEIA
jgi:hypothetical protein